MAQATLQDPIQTQEKQKLKIPLKSERNSYVAQVVEHLLEGPEFNP
jgi:hypothetical protein